MMDLVVVLYILYFLCLVVDLPSYNEKPIKGL